MRDERTMPNHGRRTKITAPLLLAIALALLALPALAADPITLKIGGSAGAVHDTLGRLVARHIGRFLPGNPEIVAINEGASGSLQLARQIESSEPADGSVFAIVSSGLISSSILTPEKTPFHADKVAWIGSMGRLPAVCAVTTASGITSIADLVTRDGIQLGATSAATKLYGYPAIIKHLYGAKFQIVQGFDGIGEIHLAMERGEIEGACGVTLNTFEATSFAEFSRIIGTFLDDLDYRGIPIPNVVPPGLDALDRAAVALQVKDEEVFGAFVMPGATDPKIVADFRAAFSRMIDDPIFKADAETVIPGLHPTNGEVVENLVREYVAADPAVVTRARELVE